MKPAALIGLLCAMGLPILAETPPPPVIAPPTSPAQIVFEGWAETCSANPDHVAAMATLRPGTWPDEAGSFTEHPVDFGNGATGVAIGAPCSCDATGKAWCGNCGTSTSFWIIDADGTARPVGAGCTRSVSQSRFQGKPAVMTGLHGGSCYDIGSAGGASPCYQMLQYDGISLRVVAKSLDGETWIPAE
jgi:hypothetical protein